MEFKALTGRRFAIDMLEGENGTFKYILQNKETGEVLLTGEGFSSEETIIEELSIISEALRDIYG